jgi:hypothetical protein
MSDNKIDIYNLDIVSFDVQDTNSRILIDAFDDYASLLKFPPFSLNKNIEKTKEFIKEVRETYYKNTAGPIFDDNFRPFKKLEKSFQDMLKEARKYRDDSDGNIDLAAIIYENNNPDEQLSVVEAIGGHLEL